MKVVAFNGSPREKGNTSIAIQIVFAELEKEGIETELVQIGSNNIRGCNACSKCKKTADGFCAINDDIVNECLKKMYASDGIIIGSPVYFGSVTTETKALIDRSGLCARAGGYLLKRKVCAAVVVARRQGAVSVFNQINNLFILNQAIIPCSIYWNMGIGKNIGEVENDEEGMKTFKVLGENMAWLLKKLKA
ncbi:MAG: flavodoxin family protein [Actinobacteria bacterium]|nr:flavodoxin family protein [Actinomycetota bacterium]